MQQVKIFETKVFSKLETDINHWIEYEYSKTGVSKLNRLAMLMLYPKMIFIITPQ